MVAVSDDPVLRRRRQAVALADAGKRLGYAAIGVASAAFLIALFAGLPGWAVTVTIVGLLVAAVVLPPAIIVGYGAAKAEREDPGTPE